MAKTLAQLEAEKKANSAAWHTASQADKDRLHAANQEIQKQIDSMSGSTSTFNPASGTWSSTPSSKPAGSSSGGGYVPSSGGGGYTGGSSPVKNNPYVSGVDDAGQTDWSTYLTKGMDSGSMSADEAQYYLDQRVNKAYSMGYTQYMNDDIAQKARSYIERKRLEEQQVSSFQQYMDKLGEGYGQVSAAEQAAIEAYIKQTVQGLESQKSGITQSADEAARQAYISYMQSQAALPQALAASGYSGGMADSQRLALDANLQNSQKDILLNRDNALNDVDTAIQQAKLEGSIQGAQAQAQLGRDAISAYQQYVQQQNALQNQNFWTKYGYDWQGGQAYLDRQHQSAMQTGSQQWQSGENEKDRDYNTGVTTQKQAYESAWNMILAGAVPDDGTLEAAGISRAEAEAVAALVKQQNAGRVSGGGGSTGSGTTPQPTGSVSQAQYNAAADRFDGGDYSPEVIETMLAAGDLPQNLARAAGFGDIASLFYGPITEQNLAQKLASGEVETIDIGGNLYYRRADQQSMLPPLGLGTYGK